MLNHTRGFTGLCYRSRERNETVQSKEHQVNLRTAKRQESCFQILAQERLKPFQDFLLWIVFGYAASEHHPPDTLNWEILIVCSKGGGAPRKPKRPDAPSPSLQIGVGVLLGLSHIPNVLLGIWILNKESNTVKVAEGPWSLQWLLHELT